MAGALQHAAVEQDREKLVVLVRRISELLEAKDQRLQATNVQPVKSKETATC